MYAETHFLGNHPVQEFSETRSETESLRDSAHVSSVDWPRGELDDYDSLKLGSLNEVKGAIDTFGGNEASVASLPRLLKLN